MINTNALTKEKSGYVSGLEIREFDDVHLHDVFEWTQ